MAGFKALSSPTSLWQPGTLRLRMPKLVAMGKLGRIPKPNRRPMINLARIGKPFKMV